MTRARVLIAAGAVLLVMSLFVNVPLHGLLGMATTAVVSMALLIAGVSAVANGIVQLRRFRGR
jgi:predicted phage tail protein